jgi:GcrA cell cycle regulator
MPANQPTWTTERLELLKIRFEAGLSCREIAADIGVSRNAVIGKLSRLSLAREKISDGPRPPRKKAEKGGRLKTPPRAQYEMLMAFYSGQPLVAYDEPIPDEYRCSLLELSEQRCRWPISNPGAADFCFCGNLPVEGLPYCTGHTRLAYRPGSRQRVARR